MLQVGKIVLGETKPTWKIPFELIKQSERINELIKEIDQLKADNEALSDVINALKSSPNEGTSAPWWTIVDPAQNMGCDVYQAAFQITGPFFSRQDAEDHLSARRYAFSKRAVVYCHSGHASKKYSKMYEAIAKHTEAK